MQLRVARLCLDCEELFVGERCPRCASERNAFLTTWLPVDERRRWNRPALRPAPAPGRLHALRVRIARWLRIEEPWLPAPPEGRPSPRTRASDSLPLFDFGEDEQKAKPAQPLDPRPARNDT
jgi:hypothetical protein